MRLAIRSTALLIALLLYSTPAADAQTRALSQYILESWDQGDGLPQNNAEALAQTGDGYLWIGTQEGIARFDGTRFTVFSHTTTDALTTSDTGGLATGADGRLWIGTLGGGVVSYRDGLFQIHPDSAGVQRGSILDLHEAEDGTLWIGASNGLWWLDGAIPSPVSGDIGAVNVLIPRRAGGVWVGTEGGQVASTSGKSLGSTRARIEGQSIQALAEGPDGTLWIGTRSGLFRSQGDELVRFPLLGAEEPFVRALAFDRSGALWVGTRGSGLFRLLDGDIEGLDTATGLPSDDIVAILGDAEGHIWFGTAERGLFLLRLGPFVGFTPSEGLSAEIVLSILESATGTLWMGTYGGGLNRVDEAGVSNYGEADGLADDFILSLAETPDGALWIGTRLGVSRFADGGFTTYGTEDGLGSSAVSALYADPSGVLWAGTSAGLSRLDGDRFTNFTVADGLSNDFIQFITRDSRGDLWIGAREGLTRLRDGEFASFEGVPGAPGGFVYAVHEDATGSHWIGTNSGLLRFTETRFEPVVTPDRALAGQVFRILEDDGGHLWLSGNTGVYRVSVEELNALVDGDRSDLPSLRHYTASDGLPSTETNGGIQPAGWKDSEGRLWFPTLEGAGFVDPVTLPEEGPAARPKIEWVTIGAEGAVLADRGTLQIPADAERLEIEFTSIDFVNGPTLRFRYRLVGFDEDWIEPTAGRVATYTNLSSGEYRFELQARSRNAEWSETTGLGIRSAAHYYETWTFRIFVLLAVAGLIFGVDHERARRQRARERSLLALVDERERAERRYRELFENANDIVVTTDLTGRIASLNRKGKELLGAPADAVLGEPFASFVAPRFRDQVELWMKHLPGGDGDRGSSSVQELELNSTDGHRFLVDASVQVIRDDGRAIGILAIMRDVSERAMLEDQLRQAQRMESVGRLAGGIAHDFNNLLGVIGSNAQLAMMDLPPDAPGREELDEIALATERAGKLTHQLLAFSRQQILKPEVLNLDDTITQVMTMLRRVIGEDVELVIRSEAAFPWISADAGQIEQVLMNLAVNARDAMPRGGRLELGTENVEVEDSAGGALPPGSYVLLTVRDNGVGMDRDTRAKAFDPFFTTKEVGKGTGLGLATVYGIIQQSGGQLAMESEVAAGTTFRIYFPRVSGPLTSRARPVESGTPAGGSETILMVEDESALRRSTGRLLTRLGYGVLDAADGTAALTVARGYERPIDLLLTDVVLPGMSGRELADELRRELPDLKVLYMSGYTDDAIVDHGVLQAGVHLLQKPFDSDGLARMVRRVIEEEATG
ncbi:MAG: two-component regulator propeller domain-containing protein [Gemmatimonadota bacterium]